MPRDKVTLSAEVRQDTDLWEKFQGFETEYASRAEAIRAGLRKGIEAGDREEKWIRFAEFLHVTAVAATAILFFSFLISSALFALGWAIAAPPGLLATLALGGVVLAFLSEPVTDIVRRLDEAAIALARKLERGEP